MPVRGFKAVTVSEEFYSDIKRFYTKYEGELRRRGIASLTACLQFLVYEAMKQYESRREAREEFEDIIGETARRLIARLKST